MRLSALRRLANDRSGASALEFALVASPLILLMLGILEVGIVYFATFSLENAVDQGARLVRTGQAQTQGFDAGKFKTAVCQYLSAPLDCSGLEIDVRHFSDFGSVNLPSPLDSNGNLKSAFNYDPGSSGDIVVVRGFYDFSLAAKMPKDIALSNMSNGDRLLTATAAFRNEPYKPE